MLQTSFHLTIPVTGTASHALNLISSVQQWWAKDFTGSAKALHDTFTVRWGDTFVTFRVSALTETSVTWTVSDSHVSGLKNPREWNDTTIQWDLVPRQGGQWDLHFMHIGLTPGIECYDMCSAGWTRYVTGSLPLLFIGKPGLPK